MALDNRSLRKSSDLGRAACSTKITYDEKRHYKPISKSEAKKKKKIQTFKSVVTKNFSTNILDVILSGKQDSTCIGFYSIYALTENVRVVRWN